MLEDDEDNATTLTLMIFAVLATALGWVVTFLNIQQHVHHWRSPELQVIIVQMLVLVIIWSTFSMLVVIQPTIKPLTQVMMDSYEAYLIVLFMHLMKTYLGGHEQVVDDINEMKKEGLKYRLGPIKLRPSIRGYTVMRFLVYQYILIKPGLSIARCVLYYMDYNGRLDAYMDVEKLFSIFRSTMMCSLVLAMLGLLMFYRMLHEKLKPYKVGIKFLAMKLFIFLHIMQAFLFSYLEGAAGHDDDKETYFFYARIEYFCVCIEMAIASFLNLNIIFTYREFLEEGDLIKPYIEYFRIDDARLAEWQSSLSNPYVNRQDSLAVEKTRLPNNVHLNDEIDEEDEENRRNHNYSAFA